MWLIFAEEHYHHGLVQFKGHRWLMGHSDAQVAVPGFLAMKGNLMGSGPLFCSGVLGLQEGWFAWVYRQ